MLKIDERNRNRKGFAKNILTAAKRFNWNRGQCNLQWFNICYSNYPRERNNMFKRG